MIGKLIWGGLLIVIGISFIIKTFFDIDIPIMRPLLGLFFIYLGYTIICASSTSNYFCKTNYDGLDNRECRKYTHEYTALFSQQTIDISHIKPLAHSVTKVKINTMFASTNVIVNPEIPTKFIVTTVFARATLPLASTKLMGTETHQSHGDNVEPVLEIYITALFGATTILKPTE